MIPADIESLRAFDLEGMKKHISWYNVMSFGQVRSKLLAPTLKKQKLSRSFTDNSLPAWLKLQHSAHDDETNALETNLQGDTDKKQIQNALQVLRDNHVPMEKVVMGMAFQGRTLMADDADSAQAGGSCTTQFDDALESCSGAKGVLTYAEIMAQLGDTETQKKTPQPRPRARKFKAIGR